MKYYLYKYYVNETLVYVGKTMHPYKRLTDHMRYDKKYRQVTNIEVCECKNKTSMNILEHMLIVSLKPSWNVANATEDLLQFPLPNLNFSRYSVTELKAMYQPKKPSKKASKKMPRRTQSKRSVTLSLDKALMDQLDEYCEKQRRTRSSAVELAIEEYVEYMASLRRATNG